MLKLERVVVPLRVLLAATFVVLLLAQVFSLPGAFAHLAEESPGDAELRWPLTVVSILELLCVQVVIVCTWRLLTMVRDDRIFEEHSLVWVDAIVSAIAAAWVLLLGVSIYLVAGSVDPELPPILLVLVVIGAALGLLMVVMRALLQQAITLRTDMEHVI